VDAKNPVDSPLLTIPTQPHGTAGAAIFTNLQNAQYAQLAEWVASIANPEIGVAPASFEEPAAAVQPTALPSVGGLSSEGSSAHNPVGAAFIAPRAAPDKPLAAKYPHAVQKNASAQTTDKNAKPADPFDPEAFNRRFHPPAESAPEPAATK
jgi:hypothetical protein